MTFLVGLTEDTSKEIQAHKYSILITRSPVFHAMICGELAKNNTSPIKLVDVEPDAFRLMLRSVSSVRAQSHMPEVTRL